MMEWNLKCFFKICLFSHLFPNLYYCVHYHRKENPGKYRVLERRTFALGCSPAQCLGQDIARHHQFVFHPVPHCQLTPRLLFLHAQHLSIVRHHRSTPHPVLTHRLLFLHIRHPNSHHQDSTFRHLINSHKQNCVSSSPTWDAHYYFQSNRRALSS